MSSSPGSRSSIATPVPEYPKFIAAVSYLGALGPDRAGEALAQRAEHLESRIEETEAALADTVGVRPGPPAVHDRGRMRAALLAGRARLDPPDHHRDPHRHPALARPGDATRSGSERDDRRADHRGRPGRAPARVRTATGRSRHHRDRTRPKRPDFCRGFNLNARSLDLLARRGLADALIDEGWQVPHAAFSGLPVTLSLAGASTDHPYSLGIPQTRVEEVLEARALDLGADIKRGHELRALEQDSASVTATIADTATGREYRARAAYLAGCDGGRSTVRRQAGIDFPGTAATRFSLLGDVELAEPETLPFGVNHGPGRARARHSPPRLHSGSSPPTGSRPPTRTPRSPWPAPVGRGRRARASRRAARRALADPVRRRRPAGGRVRPRPGHAGRRRRPHPPAGRGDRRQRRPRRRVQPRLEARRHRARRSARPPARQLPHRTPPGRGEDPGQHPGPGTARQPRRPARPADRPAHPRRRPPRGQPRVRGDRHRPRHPLRHAPGSRPPLARPPDPQPRVDHRRRPHRSRHPAHAGSRPPPPARPSRIPPRPGRTPPRRASRGNRHPPGSRGLGSTESDSSAPPAPPTRTSAPSSCARTATPPGSAPPTDPRRRRPPHRRPPPGPHPLARPRRAKNNGPHVKAAHNRGA